MKTSVGADGPENQLDADADGAADAAERDFEEDGRTLPSPTADAPPADAEPGAGMPEQAGKAAPAPDGPLASSRGQGRGPTTTDTDPH